MKIYINNHDCVYEIENLCRLFFHYEKFQIIKDYYDEVPCNEDYIYTQIKEEEDYIVLDVKVQIKLKYRAANRRFHIKGNDKGEVLKLNLSVETFRLLEEVTLISPDWGIITGVRPVKLFRSLVKEGGEDYADEYFKNQLLVKEEKISLSKLTNKYEKKILDLSVDNSFSLYISIPFCPTRCSYCSFVSQSVEKTKKLVPQYFDMLLKEIEYTAEISRSLGLNLETVYVGGGTPTTLDEYQLSKLIETLYKNFNMNRCREFTVEAGRPDTVTYEKLRSMKAGGVGRISINPQTFNDEVLDIIGRKHTSRQTIEAYNMARDCGFNNINMDLIAGLPSDSFDSFCNTLNKISSLIPEGITIHTLAVKRASYINTEKELMNLSDKKDISSMLNKAFEILTLNNYHPYYLYRQSKMVANMENIGWSKDGFDCMYNVYIMDETHTILSCGAGAVTKLRDPNTTNIERIFNYKFAYEYISQFENIIERKRKVSEFYEKI